MQDAVPDVRIKLCMMMPTLKQMLVKDDKMLVAKLERSAAQIKSLCKSDAENKALLPAFDELQRIKIAETPVWVIQPSLSA